jgi:iron complex transport system ATP-binding protein
VEGIPEDLVLNGTFDQVFQFKGFDLKTGKMHHKAYRNLHVQLIGDGHELLWTKNALERNGYEITNRASLQIEIKLKNEQYCWQLKSASGTQDFTSLADLLHVLRENYK